MLHRGEVIILCGVVTKSASLLITHSHLITFTVKISIRAALKTGSKHFHDSCSKLTVQYNQSIYCTLTTMSYQ